MEGWPWFKFNNLGLALGKNLKFYTSVAKGLKLKVIKIWGLNLKFVEVTGGKLVAELFAPLSILNRVNRLQGRALRINYDDDVSTFDKLLAMDKSFCIHHQNINRLLIEIYKALHDISENSLKELFVKRESTINLWSNPELVISSVNSILSGKISLRYFGFVIWNSLPIDIREDHLISSFVTTKIKQWKPFACPCLSFAYLIYADSPFDECFMTFVMYILDFFIAQMGLQCK